VLDVMLPKLDGFALCERMRVAAATTRRCCSSRRAARPRTACAACTPAPTTTSPSRSTCPSSCCGCARCCAGAAGGATRPATPSPATSSTSARGRSRRATARREALGERELGILRLLTARAGEVVPRDDILDEVWGDDAFPSSRTVDNVVVRLRRLIERDPSNPVHIHTVWGVGYRFTPEPESEARRPPRRRRLDTDAPWHHPARDLEGGGA
jgi:two-component system, OmpR family, alkaline phosphatase synthesis response regulator PhoP